MSTSARVVTGTAAVAAAFAMLLAGCAPSSKQPAPMPAAASPPRASTAPCAAYHCAPGAAQQLSGGYSVRLWSSAQPSAADAAGQRSTPVLELLRDGQHLNWWVGRLGYGWAATLRCLPTPAAPNCMVLAQLGAHAGSAEAVLLRTGTLVSPAPASVVFDSGLPTAADLDHDGELDVLGVENDYQPNYASGHNFWTSYRLTGDALHQTGCSPVIGAGQPAPTTLLTGHCPAVAQS